MEYPPLQPNAARARQAWLFILAVLIITALEIPATLLEMSVIRNYLANPDGYQEGDFDLSDALQGLLGLGHVALYLAAAVFFVRWMARAHANYELASQNASLYTSSAVKWAFFIPILNLFRPYQILKEMRDDLQKIVGGARNNYPNWRLGTWWGFWIVAQIISQVVFRLSLNYETVEELLYLDYWVIFSNLLDLAAGGLVYGVIRDQQALEDQYETMRRIQELEGGQTE
ncbi:MAG: DUF4328 domain-containing protein [Bacteroidota bacterium]